MCEWDAREGDLSPQASHPVYASSQTGSTADGGKLHTPERDTLLLGPPPPPPPPPHLLAPCDGERPAHHLPTPSTWATPPTTSPRICPAMWRAGSTGGPTRVNDSHKTGASQCTMKTARWPCDGGDMHIENCRVVLKWYAPLFLSVATTYANGTASTGISLTPHLAPTSAFARTVHTQTV
jgi:hypothetical protein